MTVNRVCGSGAQAVVSAADDILLGRHELAVEGGMENKDRVPYLLDGGRWGFRVCLAAERMAEVGERPGDAEWPVLGLTGPSLGNQHASSCPVCLSARYAESPTCKLVEAKDFDDTIAL